MGCQPGEGLGKLTLERDAWIVQDHVAGRVENHTALDRVSGLVDMFGREGKVEGGLELGGEHDGERYIGRGSALDRGLLQTQRCTS